MNNDNICILKMVKKCVSDYSKIWKKNFVYNKVRYEKMSHLSGVRQMGFYIIQNNELNMV